MSNATPATPLTRLLSVLSTMRAPSGDGWGNHHTEAYALGLADLPEADIPALAKAVLRSYSWRPSVAEILDTHAQLTAPATADAETLPDVFARLRRLVARYGEYGAVHPAFPDAWPVIRDLGAPPDLAIMPPAAQKTVAALGGWVEFARSFDWSSGTDRAQFRDLYNASSVSAKDSVLRAIRDDYRTRAAPKITGPEPVDGADTSAPSSAIGRSEASDIMSRVGQIVRPLYGE